MVDGQVYLDTLNTESRSYKVKVKVLLKGKPQRSASNVLYQTMLLQDDKGNKMRATLFGDQIAGHVDALVYNGVYEIANAPIRAMHDQYRRDPSELPYTMGFGRNTFIRPLSSAPGPFLPDYECVSQVPKTATPYDIFDVIGTMLYVEPAAREVNAKHGRTNAVREVVLTDHSTEQPVVISTWNELAKGECDQLVSLVGSFPVVGFTALRVSTHRGFSLTGTMSTSIDTSPTGDKVVALREWVGRSKEMLAELQAQINSVRDPGVLIRILTLSALKLKRATNTLQDEHYRLVVTVPHPDLQKVNAYLGCSNCGKRSDYAAGDKFKCETCTRDGVVSEPRITFNCEISDGTDQLEITAFSEDTTRLFRMSAPDIFRMKHADDITTFGKVRTLLQTVPFTVQVSPKTTLSRNNILQWALRQVVAGPEGIADVLGLPQAQPADISITADTTKQQVAVARQLDFGGPPEQSMRSGLVDATGSPAPPSTSNHPAPIVTGPEPVQAPSSTSKAAGPTQLATSSAALACTTPAHQSPALAAIPATNMPGTPVLKTPKVEKTAACTPETPVQGTPKRATAKQPAESPSKKTKATVGSAADH